MWRLDWSQEDSLRKREATNIDRIPYPDAADEEDRRDGQEQLVRNKRQHDGSMYEMYENIEGPSEEKEPPANKTEVLLKWLKEVYYPVRLKWRNETGSLQYADSDWLEIVDNWYQIVNSPTHQPTEQLTNLRWYQRWLMVIETLSLLAEKYSPSSTNSTMSLEEKRVWAYWSEWVFQQWNFQQIKEMEGVEKIAKNNGWHEKVITEYRLLRAILDAAPPKSHYGDSKEMSDQREININRPITYQDRGNYINKPRKYQ